MNFFEFDEQVYFWIGIVILGRETMDDGAKQLDEDLYNDLHCS